MAASGRRGGSRGGAGSGESRSQAGCLGWLIALALVFLLFVVYWGKIQETLERTNFNEIVKTQRQTEDRGEPAPVTPAPKVEDPALNPQSSPSTGTASPSAQSGSGPKGGASQDPASVAGQGRESPAAAAERALDAAAPPEASPTAVRPAKTRTTSLFFVRIDEDGTMVRQEVKRAVPASDSPLTDALNALIKGPNDEELRKQLVSLVPSGTRLLGVRIQGTTAVVDLSEPFMYNHYGIEGYAGQLKQVVYTATAFPTVHDVQILIEGERHDYLGGEGVYIGRPLSRNSF